MMKFGLGSEIYGECEPVEYVYEVMDGAVRTVKVMSDGRRKIGGFYFAGDIFGLEDGNEHSLSAEAVVPSAIRVIKRGTLLRLTADDLRLAKDLVIATMGEVARAHQHALMLVMTAQERINNFLVEMAQRTSIGDLVRLPMSRRDIADYLGLTVETVSRTISCLAAASTIHLPSSRTVVLRNRPALERGTGAKGPHRMNPSKETSDPESLDLSDIRILVVEDSWQIGMAVTDLLNSLGAEVIGPVATAADALSLASEQPPDAALIDFNLRAGELADGLIERLHEQGIYVIVTTGYTVLPAVLRSAVPILHKPISETALLDSLQPVVARKPQG